MNAIYGDAVHALQPEQSVALAVDKATVRTKVRDCTTRLYAPQNVSPCQVLVLDGDGRLTVNASCPHLPQRYLR
jgi:RecA/RadA recombinase